MTYLAPATRTYLFHALDPLHVGTGGTRLGRVDNTVARDPATRLPKVPGSGISGAVKDAYDLSTLVSKSPPRPGEQRCAGAKGCGKELCEVCALFGTAPDDEGASGKESRRGIIAFRDARLVAMPVASLTGPVWMMDEDFARDMGFVSKPLEAGDCPHVAAAPGLAVERGQSQSQILNLGSLLFCGEKITSINPAALKSEALAKKISFLNGTPVETVQKVFSRVVVCPSSIFPLLADTAMEVRTSVSIDPETGAADPHKLFTMEAVPAGAIFKTRLDYLGGKVPVAISNIAKDGEKCDAGFIFDRIQEHGFAYLAITGIGGNVTRGFGRVSFFGYLIPSCNQPGNVGADPCVCP